MGGRGSGGQTERDREAWSRCEFPTSFHVGVTRNNARANLYPCTARRAIKSMHAAMIDRKHRNANRCTVLARGAIRTYAVLYRVSLTFLGTDSLHDSVDGRVRVGLLVRFAPKRLRRVSRRRDDGGVSKIR